MWAPPKKLTIFKPFLDIFTLFHLKNLQLCKIFPSYIYGTPQVMFGLVNNHGKWCQMSWVIFHDWTFLVGMCVAEVSITGLLDRSSCDHSGSSVMCNQAALFEPRSADCCGHTKNKNKANTRSRAVVAVVGRAPAAQLTVLTLARENKPGTSY